MASVNKVTLIGNLGGDPKVTTTQGGKTVARLNLATNESFRSGDQKVVKTEWHNVVAWEGLADYCSRYLHTGSMVYVEGKITTRSYEPKEGGEKKWVTEIVAHSIQGLDPRQPRDGDAPQQGASLSPQPQQRAAQPPPPRQGGQMPNTQMQAPPQQYPGYNPNPPGRGQQQPQQQQRQPAQQANQMGTPEFFDDDIPF